MLRIILAIGIFVALNLASLKPAQAYEGPWCALRNFGSDLSEDCQYHSFEECRRTIVAGIRGFCNPNPRWQVAPGRARPHWQG
jgi:hypothetical protein